MDVPPLSLCIDRLQNLSNHGLMVRFLSLQDHTADKALQSYRFIGGGSICWCSKVCPSP
ncbi:hypothetical protein FHW16_002071 [Phyllobacterium myrsinacearum]|uniref:Uncharacterized protein n=1 Tax=Phyllobacterium myrsinacearum TaxID=28101 RepID=A0A839EHU0_9HYPH|nr:hypothetical protein [Phyllobacterium myrsinacearum]